MFACHEFSAVMHFASFIQVDEPIKASVKNHNNNFAAMLMPLEAMCKADVFRFIFSSNAGVYGDPEYVTIDERHRKEPINLYGGSKRTVEQVWGTMMLLHMT
jgi:UDP-glucose 4-epimerase